ncbi:hypothetical protein [Nocardia aurantia]|uniref:hypothetical protein n=1 Tax=Nocardia aurantia TaxID=2585199 RepID=UPI001296E038|nr:hypothetical protein [Nocardia aurantia]
MTETGKALVTLAGTEVWPAAKDAVTGWWRQHLPGQAAGIAGDLDQLRTEVAGTGDDRPARDALAGEWQSRLRRLLAADPALAVALRHLLTGRLAPLLDTVGDTTTVTQTATVTGNNNTTVQAGRDVTTSSTRVVNAAGAIIGAIGDHNNHTNHFHRPQ